MALALLLAACASQRFVPPPQPAPQPETPASTPAPQPQATVPSETPDAGPVKVGLLLPLSGSNAGVGQALLQAAEMALFERAPTEFELVVRDTELPGGAAAAAAQLVVGERVRLILGPLFGAQVPQAAAAARASNVTLVSFSNDRSVAGPSVYVMGVLPQLQIDRVVGYAAGRGLERFAGLLPDNAFGRTVASALQSSVLRNAAVLSLVDFYNPNSPDLHVNIERIAKARSEFDALLIPEAGERLKLFAQYMSYYGFDQTAARFLGSTLWNDPSLAQEPVLVGSWFAAPPELAWTDFAARYRSNYGAPPPRIASIAYDATALAIALAQGEGGIDTGVELLTNPDGFNGVDGIFRFLPDGSVERGLAVMELQNGRIETIDPAPTSFLQPGL